MRCVRIVAAGALALGMLGTPVQAAVPEGGWGPPVAVSSKAGDLWDLELALHRGRGLAVWVRWHGRSSRVEAAWQRADGGWRQPVEVIGVPRNAAEVEVAFDAAGRARLVWTHNRWVETAFLTRDGYAPLSSRVARTPRGSRPAHVRLAVNGGGAAVVAWETMDGDDAPPYATPSVQAMARDARGGWGQARTLSSSEAEAYRPEVFVDRTGRATVTWDERQGRASRVWTASRVPGFGWADPEPLAEAAESSGPAQLAGLPSGRLAVAWPTRSEDRRGLAVRQWSSAAGWSSPVRVRSARLPSWTDLGLSRRGPVVALAAATRRVDARQRVVVARVSRDGAVSRTRLAPAVAVYYGMHLVVNRAGDALVAWDSVRGGDHPIEAAYGARDGSWGPVTRVSAVRGDAFLGAVALRRDGHALAVWNGGDITDPDSSRVWARAYLVP